MKEYNRNINSKIFQKEHNIFVMCITLYLA